MRLLVMLVAVPLVIGVGALVVGATFFRPPTAASRLAGVHVLVAGYTVVNLGDRRHRLDLPVTVDSPRDLDECLAFALDEPFGSRKIESADRSCVSPKAGRQTAALAFARLTEDDLAFPSHMLVWGIRGGRCGLILEAFGVCVVEQAGTTPLMLPSRSVLPSIGPLGSFLPIFSFEAP